jgi:hypothetical protein
MKKKKKLSQIERHFEKALKDFPKLVKQKEKAAKEKKRILKNFESFSKALFKKLDKKKLVNNS